MSFTDNRLLFAEAQEIGSGDAGGAGNPIALTDFINLSGDFDIGPGKLVYWVVQMVTSPGDTLTFDLETDSDSGFATTLTDLASLVFAESVAAGTQKWIAVPSANLQYLRAVVKPTDDDGASVFTSYITSQQPNSWVAFPDNVPDLP